MLPRLKSSILTGKLQWDAHICGNPTPLCLPPSFHLAIHLWHCGLLCTTYYFPSACLPTIFLKQFALTTAMAFAVLNHSVIYFYTSYLKNSNSLLMSVSFNFQFIWNTCDSFFKYKGKHTFAPVSDLYCLQKLTSKTLSVQTRTSLVTEFISLLPYLSEGNGSFPSTWETIQNIPPTSFTPVILYPLQRGGGERGGGWRRAAAKNSSFTTSKLLAGTQIGAYSQLFIPLLPWSTRVIWGLV